MRRANSACGASDSTASRNSRSAARMRRDEIGRAGRVADILVGRLHALDVVALDQALAAPAPASTAASFQARFSASWMPELAPRAPNGET